MNSLSNYTLSNAEQIYLAKLVSDLKNLNPDRAALISIYAKEFLQIHLVKELIEARKTLQEESNSDLFDMYSGIKSKFIQYLESNETQYGLDPWRSLALISNDEEKGVLLRKISWHVRDVIAASNLILAYEFSEAIDSLKKDVANLNKKMTDEYLEILGGAADDRELLFIKNKLIKLEQKLDEKNNSSALKITKLLQDKFSEFKDVKKPSKVLFLGKETGFRRFSNKISRFFNIKL